MTLPCANELDISTTAFMLTARPYHVVFAGEMLEGEIVVYCLNRSAYNPMSASVCHSL